MLELYRDGIDTEEEFELIFDIASLLWRKQKTKNDHYVERLSEIGTKAIGPILYCLECNAPKKYQSRDEYANFYNDAQEVMVRIGDTAHPILEKYLSDGNTHMEVNDFTQLAVFNVLGLKGKKRQNVCKHGMARRFSDNQFSCIYCGKIMSEDEYK